MGGGRVKYCQRRQWFPENYQNLLDKERDVILEFLLQNVNKLPEVGSFAERWEFFRVFRAFLTMEYDLTEDQCLIIALGLFKWIMCSIKIDVWLHTEALELLQQFLMTYRPIHGLVVPWKPLYQLLLDTHLHPKTVTAPETHSGALANLITCLRPYFTPDSVKEILIELRGYFCRFDCSLFPAQAILCHFLPSYLHYWWHGQHSTLRCETLDEIKPKYVPVQRAFWLEEVMSMWHWEENNKNWDALWLELISRTITHAYCLSAPLYKAIRRSRQLSEQNDQPIALISNFGQWGDPEERLFQQWYQTISTNTFPNNISQQDDSLHEIFATFYKQHQTDNESITTEHCNLFGILGGRWNRFLGHLFRKFHKVVSSRIRSSPFGSMRSEYFPSSLQFMMNNTCRSAIDSVGYSIVQLLCSSDLALHGFPENQKPFDYFTRLLKFLEPYCHPSSEGKWQNKICYFLKNLCFQLATRHGSEIKQSQKLQKLFDRLQSEITQLQNPTQEQHHNIYREFYILQMEKIRQNTFFLTKGDIEKFVDITAPLVKKSMYAKNGNVFSMQALQALAYLSPNKILPMFLENVFYDLETFTHTHRTTTALLSLSYVARLLFSPEHQLHGGCHLEALLQCTLPGIDPNDQSKTHLTLRFYYALLYTIPLICAPETPPSPIDQVKRRTDASLTEAEEKQKLIKTTIAATRYFTDWALELLERIFAMFKLLSTKLRDQEIMINLQSTVALLFEQASDDLYERLLQRVFQFATTNNLPYAIGPVATLCGSITIPNPRKVLELFFPYFYNQFVEEKDDKTTRLHNCSNSEFIWGLAILMKIFSRCGKILLLYQREISILLDLLIKSEKGKGETPAPSTKVNKFAFKLWRSTLKALTRTYVLESRSSPPREWKQALQSRGIDLLAYWGQSCDFTNLEPRWHIPTREEILWAIELANQYGYWAIEQITEFANNSLLIQKDKQHIPPVLTSDQRRKIREWIHLVRMGYQGVGEICLYWRKYEEETEEERAYVKQFGLQVQYSEVLLPSIDINDLDPLLLQFTFHTIAKTLHLLCTALVGDGSACDDIKTLSLLIRTIGAIFYPPYGQNQRQNTKLILRTNIAYNPLDPKDLPRHVYIHQAALQHLHRIQFYRGRVSAAIWHLVEDLLTLSLHPYSKIRVYAQENFCLSVMRYQLPREKLAERLISVWSDIESPEHKIIGSSFLLSTETIIYMIFDSWSLLRTFIQSIFNTHNHTSHKLHSIIHGTMILYEHCMFPLPITVYSNENSPLSIQQTKENKANYRAIIDFTAKNACNLSWSFQERLLHYMYHLVIFGRKETPSIHLCQYLLKCLQSDVVVIRSSAVDVLTQLLLNLIIKRPRKKIQNEIQVDQINLFQREFQCTVQKVPQSSEEWEATSFIDSNFYGWNGKTSERKTYLPLTEEEHVDREQLYSASVPYSEYQKLCEKYNLLAEEEIYECRKILASHFCDMKYWRSVLIGWAHEGREGEDVPDYSTFFQLCFAHFPKMIDSIQPLLLELCQQEDHVEPQCLASEITGGMIRGSKHWSFTRIQEMREFILPLFDRSLSVPHFKCWRDVTYFAVSAMDYRRVDWIYKHFETKVSLALQQNTQSIQVTHIFEYMLAIFSCLSWRAAGLGAKIFRMVITHEYLYEAPLLVRASIGEVLQVIITLMYSGIRDPVTHIPIVAPVSSKTCNLQEYYPEIEEIIAKIADDILQSKLSKRSATILEDEEQRRQNRFVHCILIMLLPNVENYLRRIVPIIFPLFPVSLLLIDDREVDIANTAWKVVGAFASSEFDPFWMEKLFDLAIDILMDRFDLRSFSKEQKQESDILHCSWRVRCSTLTFLQTFVSQNMFFLTESKIEKLLNCLHVSLAHSQVEVRHTAGNALSGVLRFMDEEQQILLWDSYAEEAKSPIETNTINSKEQLIHRHRAILGMAAIVNVHPYSIPDWLPNRLVEFATHIHDPIPVKNTVKNTFLGFWRVHQDSWATEKECFTSEQLSFLVELLVSPSYFV